MKVFQHLLALACVGAAYYFFAVASVLSNSPYMRAVVIATVIGVALLIITHNIHTAMSDADETTDEAENRKTESAGLADRAGDPQKMAKEDEMRRMAARVNSQD